MAVALIHASTGVPPTEQPMIPIGTLVSWNTLRAKNQATAEKSLTVSGEATCQRPSARSVSGMSDKRDGTLKNRILGKFALAISFSISSTPLPTFHSMFDWPEASQTSPKKMSSTAAT